MKSKHYMVRMLCPHKNEKVKGKNITYEICQKYTLEYFELRSLKENKLGYDNYVKKLSLQGTGNTPIEIYDFFKWFHCQDLCQKLCNS